MSTPPASTGGEATLVRLSQLARFWGLHTRTLHGWIREGRLAALRSPGNHFRLRVADIRAFCEREGKPVPPFVSGHTRRVVVAGAAPAQRRALGRALRGVAVEVAANPYEALVTAAVAPPELLALGLGDARFDGAAATRALKQTEATAGIVVVAFDVPNRAQALAIERSGGARALLASGRESERLPEVLAELVGA